MKDIKMYRKDVVKKWRKKTNDNEKKRNNYHLLRSKGFDSYEADRLKFKSDENIDEAIKKRMRANYEKLINSGFTHEEADLYKLKTDNDISKLIIKRVRKE